MKDKDGRISLERNEVCEGWKQCIEALLSVRKEAASWAENDSEGESLRKCIRISQEMRWSMKHEQQLDWHCRWWGKINVCQFLIDQIVESTETRIDEERSFSKIKEKKNVTYVASWQQIY